MTFPVITNIATMILCVAVLVQAVRLMRAFDTVKNGALTDVVVALETSTNEARRVLGKLTDLLRGDVADTARTLSEGKAMVEELTVMTGIANAIAERIVEAAGASNRSNPDVAAANPAAAPAEVAATASASPADGDDARRVPVRAPRRSRAVAAIHTVVAPAAVA